MLLMTLFADVVPDAATAAFEARLKVLEKMHVEDVLLPVLIQLIIIVAVARAVAVLFRKIGQPGVVGEIAAGLLLGPSLLKWVFPSLWAAIFHPLGPEGVTPEEFNLILQWLFTILSQLGLIFLLFLIGLEFDFNHLRWHGKAALAISVTGVAIPFALGLGLAWLMHPSLEPHDRTDQPVPALGFALFLGTALSITAIPILGRMMMEWGITRTRLGAITISAAAVDDATGWIILAAVAAVVRSAFEPTATLLMVAGTVAFALIMVFVARPVLRWWVRGALRRHDGEIGLSDLAVLIVVMLLCSIATNLIGIYAIFGAFFLGAVLSDEHEFRQAVARRLRDFISVFFLPIFFTYTGLRTDVQAVGSGWMWVLCGLVLLAAIVGKFLGCGLAARLSGLSWREAGCVGVMMNTRALMELIVINLGYELRVIPKSVFCMLVLMALITTVMTSPILLRLMRGTELEPYILRSGFLGTGPEDGAEEPEPAGAGPPGAG